MLRQQESKKNKINLDRFFEREKKDFFPKIV